MAARNVPSDLPTLTPNGLDTERFHTLLRSTSGPHEAIPDDLLAKTENQDASFLDFPPDVPSAEEDRVRYCGVVKSLGPDEEKTAVVETWAGPKVACSTKGCQGAGRLREGELVIICYHMSGEDQGKTLITHVAAECTPVSSLAVSRAGSRAPTRPPTPAGS